MGSRPVRRTDRQTPIRNLGQLVRLLTSSTQSRRPALLIHGNNLNELPKLPDNSVDAIITDPPYELGFMGKTWDSTGIAYNIELWQQCLRVLKPGGHLLAFSGSRTYHRMAVAIEDAGFQIRDQIMWVYGSGFPKSLDVSKAIDKMDAADEQMARRYRFTTWVKSTGVTARQIDEATNTVMGGHYTTAASQPAIMTREHLEACRHLLGEIPEWVELEADIRSVESRNFAEREVVGTRKGNEFRFSPGTDYENIQRELDITAPATDEAKQWEGWGTTLKPAHEPIVLARKPLDGTVARNVLTHGVGGINIDGCRVDFISDEDRDESTAKNQHQDFGTEPMTNNTVYGDYSMIKPTNYNPPGRFPANFIHDGSDEVLELFPADKTEHSAARFFYCAKANKTDRNEGLDDFPLVKGGSMTENETRPDRPTNHPFRANHHPTVKPTDLMRYLCRLITPPGGTILDPFTGSGSTGKAATLEGFNFIGIELDPDYIAIAEARIQHAYNQRH